MAKYIKSLSIETFRGIKNLTLQDFGDVNIFTGGNNCGKTSVLEVIMSIEAPCKLDQWDFIGKRVPLNYMNNMSCFETINNLFDIDEECKKIKYSYQLNSNQMETIELIQDVQIVELTKADIMKIDAIGGSRYIDLDETDECREYPVRKMEIKFQKNEEKVLKEEIYEFQRRIEIPAFREVKFAYVYPEEHLSNDCSLDNLLDNPELYQELLEILKSFDEDIISINATVDKVSKKVVYKLLSKKHKNAIPINMFGDGMKKVKVLLENMCVCINGVLIVDEFETGIHTSGMEKIFGWLVQICKKLNIQLFLSSHSIEAIEKLIKSTPDKDIDMKLYTLYREDGENLARNMDAREAVKFYDEMGLELR